MRRVTDNVMDFYLHNGGDLRRAEEDALRVAVWTRLVIEELLGGPALGVIKRFAASLQPFGGGVGLVGESNLGFVMPAARLVPSKIDDDGGKTITVEFRG